jgi:hypothetical protein
MLPHSACDPGNKQWQVPTAAVHAAKHSSMQKWLYAVDQALAMEAALQHAAFVVVMTTALAATGPAQHGLSCSSCWLC